MGPKRTSGATPAAGKPGTAGQPAAAGGRAAGAKAAVKKAPAKKAPAKKATPRKAAVEKGAAGKAPGRPAGGGKARAAGDKQAGAEARGAEARTGSVSATRRTEESSRIEEAGRTGEAGAAGRDPYAGPVATGTAGPKPPVVEKTLPEEPAGKKRPTRPPVVRHLRRAVVVLLVLGVCGFLIDGASRPANPSLVPAADPMAARGSPAFGAVTLSVNPGRHAPACVLEAVTTAQQNYGLMNRTSVAPYAGMAFVFPAPSADLFYMKNTMIPLSIAWFDESGRFETSTVMAPCPKTAASCPTYGPGRPYTLAVEVPAGRLGALGIGPGSTVHLGGACS